MRTGKLQRCWTHIHTYHISKVSSYPRNLDPGVSLVLVVAGDPPVCFLLGVTKLAESKLSKVVLVLSRMVEGGSPAAGTLPTSFFTWQWVNMGDHFRTLKKITKASRFGFLTRKSNRKGVTPILRKCSLLGAAKGLVTCSKWVHITPWIHPSPFQSSLHHFRFLALYNLCRLVSPP